MEISFFKNIKDTTPKTTDFRSFGEFAKRHLLHHRERQDKDGPLMSFAIFKKQRTLDDVLAVQGAALDFDIVNADEPPHKIFRILESRNIEYAWHTTHSATEENPKYRVYIPFSAPVPPSQYPHVFAWLQDILQYPDGLDRTCAEVARSYYLPSAMPDCYRASDYFSGEILEVGAIVGHATVRNSNAAISEPPSGINNGGRNTKLKNIACAMLARAEPLDKIVEELIDVDSRNSPPLFTDATEGFRNSAYAGALRFLANIAKSVDNVILQPSDDVSRPVVSEPQPTADDSIFFSAPGLVGRIARYINETSIFEHPRLALGAALAFVGAIKAHRVKSETNLRTNLLCAGLAHSGKGKNHALESVKYLATKAEIIPMLIGKPASDTALLRTLVPDAKKLLLLDELGLSFSSMTGGTAPAYQMAILQVVMELFSSAGSIYLGREYATQNLARITINQPHLCLYGVSTPLRFWGAFGSVHAIDGFLARWLIFDSKNTIPLRKEPTQVDPDPIVHEIQAIMGEKIKGANFLNPEPLVVKCGCKHVLKQYADWWDKKSSDSMKAGDSFDPIYSRGLEHVIKVALTVGGLDENNLHWAQALVERLTEDTVKNIGLNVADNRHVSRQQKILQVLEAHPNGLKQRDLFRATKAMLKNERQDALDTLIEAGEIERFKNMLTGGRSGVTYCLARGRQAVPE